MEGDIIHYEIPAKNPAKLSKFYANVVGWKFSDAGMPGMKYLIIRTSKKTALPSGGMYKKLGHDTTPRTYVSVNNIDVSTRKLVKNGGKVLVPKQAIPGMGWSVIAKDIEGNPLGLFQPDMSAGKLKSKKQATAAL